MRALAHSTDRLSRGAGVAAAVGLHMLAAVFLLSYEPARTALLANAPIMVDWIAPPRPEPAPPEPPRPRPIVKPIPRPSEPPSLITAPAESPALVAVLPTRPAPPPPDPVPALVAVPVVVTPPIFNAEYLDNPAPEYPRLSRRNGEQGRLVLRVLVNAAGRADDIEVRTSSGYPRLDQSAHDTVRNWRFVPAKRGDEPVPAWVLIPISFRLEG